MTKYVIATLAALAISSAVASADPVAAWRQDDHNGPAKDQAQIYSSAEFPLILGVAY